MTSGAGIKACDGFASFPAECQRGLSSVGSVALAPHADLCWGWDQGWGHGGLQRPAAARVPRDRLRSEQS